MNKIMCLCGKYREDVTDYICKSLVGVRSLKCNYCDAGVVYKGICRHPRICNAFKEFIDRSVL